MERRWERRGLGTLRPKNNMEMCTLASLFVSLSQTRYWKNEQLGSANGYKQIKASIKTALSS